MYNKKTTFFAILCVKHSIEKKRYFFCCTLVLHGAILYIMQCSWSFFDWKALINHFSKKLLKPKLVLTMVVANCGHHSKKRWIFGFFCIVLQQRIVVIVLIVVVIQKTTTTKTKTKKYNYLLFLFCFFLCLIK